MKEDMQRLGVTEEDAGIGGGNQLWCPLKAAAAAGSFMLSPADLTAVGILSSDSVRTQKIKVS